MMNILQITLKIRAIPGPAARVLAVPLALLSATAPVLAQQPSAAGTADAELAALLAEAETNNPELFAAKKALEAARARVPQAGALPDPTVGVGLMYLPVSTLSYGTEGMTMTSVGVSGMLPFPGKLALREETARLLADAAQWEVERVRQRVVSEVKSAYYELYLVDRALEITRQNELLLADFARLSSAKYGVGGGAQADVLKAQVERTRLEEELVSLRQRWEAVAARLNALLGRPTGAPLPAPAIPERLLEVATAPAPPGQVTFASASALVGGGRAGEGAWQIPAVEALQRRALEHNPMIRRHVQRIAAQRTQIELAGKATLPDFHISLGYGQRSGGFGDLVSAVVSVPVPVFAGRKQQQAVVEEEATLADLEAQYAAMVTLAIIFLLLYFNFGSVSESVLVMASLPFALVGSVWLLWALGYNLSVAVWVGIIALAGVAAETGVVMLVYLDHAWEARRAQGKLSARDLYEAILEGAVLRVRPKLMTCERHHRRPPADPPGRRHRRHSHEADRRADGGRHGLIRDPHPGRDPGRLLPVARLGAEAGARAPAGDGA